MFHLPMGPVGILQWTWNENAMHLCQENPFKMSSAINGLDVLDTSIQSNKQINTSRDFRAMYI